MKNIGLILLLTFISLSGFSQPDSSSYYAASRLDYYTDEEAGEIMVYVPERLKGVKITIDLVFEYQNLTRGYPAFSVGLTTVPFPMELLREGQNEVTVSFYENEKWTDSRKIMVMIRPDRQNAVKIDHASGGIVASGLPLVPFGFLTSFPADVEKAEGDILKGFNQVSPFRQVNRKSLNDRKACMNRFADLGARVNYNLAYLLNDGGDAVSGTKKMDMLRKEVEAFRDNPALFTWCIAESPDLKDLKPDSLLKAYRLIKELDPYHPVCMMLGSPRNAAAYRDVLDIAITAPNPVPQGIMLEVKDYTRIPKQAFWMEKPVWIEPQTYGGSKYWQREPTPREVRAMTYMAIINGATGILYDKSSPNGPKSTSLWDECAAMALEIAELTPDILSPHPVPELIPDNTWIHAKAWNRAGLVTIAVVNDRNEPGTFILKMKDIDLTIEADVLFENRKIQVKNGVIGDIIDGYGTRVYRFDARQKPDWMKDLQSGNLAVDPGFEDISNAGVPSACIVIEGSDAGNTYFIDSRRYYKGEHSLRMNNPSGKPGDRLSFFGLDLSSKKSYSVSIMARTGASSNIPAGKKEKTVSFRLGLGDEGKIFTCTEQWQKYEITGVRINGDARVSPFLEMAGKGTAWFDNLQVYPDIDLTETKGSAENLRIIELKCIHPDAQIFFTTDGSEPASESQPYLIPLEVDAKVIIKAAAFKNNKQVGYIER